MTCNPCATIKAMAKAMGCPQETADRSYSWYCTCNKPWTYDDVPAPRRTTGLKVRIVERPDGSRIKAFAHDTKYIGALVDDRIWRFYE